MANLITTYNPATSQEITSYPMHDETKVAKAVAASKSLYQEWRKVSITERGAVLKSIAKELRKEKEFLAKTATMEMGKPINQSRIEVEKCAFTLEYYAQEGEKYLKDEIIETDATKSYVTFQPLGVILAVMPWNFPYWQVFRAFAPIVMSGNTMLLKHASGVCACALAIEKVIYNSDAPKGLLQTLLIPSSRVEALIDDPTIAAVTLTGSTEAGSKVAEAAGRNLKKTVLELGGSDAYLVLEEADLELAAEICVKGRIVNSGQSCIAAKRLIAVKSIRKAFEKIVIDKMKQVTFGDPMNEENKIGPLARIDLRNQLHSQVIKSIELGAKLACGGYIPEMEGAYYPPTVLTGVKAGMPAYEEEIFGPVAVIIEAKDETDGIRIANDSLYGLGACVISKNIEVAERIARTELEAGNCYVNDSVHSDPHLPFGGIKQSGYGRELGLYGIREFTNIKSVYVK